MKSNNIIFINSIYLSIQCILLIVIHHNTLTLSQIFILSVTLTTKTQV